MLALLLLLPAVSAGTFQGAAHLPNLEGSPPEGADLTIAAPPGSPALDACATPTLCANLPFVVDEDGDIMTGDLNMRANVVFSGDNKVSFPGGSLGANPELKFNAQLVCLAGGNAAGCGDITGVGAGFGLLGGGPSGDVALAVDPTLVQQRVTGVCAGSTVMASVNQDGSVNCVASGQGSVTSVGSGFGLLGGPITTAGTLSVNPSTVQQRITGTCGTANFLRVVNQDGTVTCGSYSAGTGLTLTGTTFATNPAVVQNRVTGVCAPGNFLQSIAQDGTVACAADANSGGTVTNVASGFGLLGGPITGTGTLSVNPSLVQQRVTGTCAAGSSIRNIAQDGTVTCETDDGLTYTNGTGLLLTGTTFSADTGFLQRRVTGSCAVGTFVRAVASDGTVTCGADANSGGTVTSVASGSGLTGGPITGSGTLSIAAGGVTNAMLAANAVGSSVIIDGSIGGNDVNVNAIQVRVAGQCAAGSSIRAIDSAGAVTCQTDGVGPWTQVGTKTFIAPTGTVIGVGTSNPSVSTGNSGVHINGTVNVGLRLTQTSFNDSDWTLFTSACQPSLVLENQTGGDILTLYEDGTMRIKSTSSNACSVPPEALDVGGDVRIGTGTTGCLKDRDATILAGTCSSDLRFKQNVEPFGPALEKVAQLEPVFFDWKAEEFPAKDFGSARSHGLIAQDVAKVLPSMVTTDEDGYEAVRYAMLPLYLLQAVKELKEQNDLLQSQVQTQQALLEELARELRQPDA